MPTNTRSLFFAKKHLFLLALSLIALSGQALAVSPNFISMPPDDTMLDRREGLKVTDNPAFQIELKAAAQEARFACERHIDVLVQKAELALATQENRTPTDFSTYSTVEKIAVLRDFNILPAIVVDIDETVLDNRKEWRNQVSHYDSALLENPKKAAKDFPHGANTFDSKSNDKWIQTSQAPEIKPVTSFVRWAKGNKIAIFFVTGRPDAQTEVTKKNLDLHKIPYDGLILRRPDQNQRAEDFKSISRSDIEKMGYTIICNIGDQESDLYGLHSLECIKVPNPIYFIK